MEVENKKHRFKDFSLEEKREYNRNHAKIFYQKNREAIIDKNLKRYHGGYKERSRQLYLQKHPVCKKYQKNRPIIEEFEVIDVPPI